MARDLEGVRRATPLAGRRVIVTGAAGTFGRALGARFTELDARVCGLDLHADASAPVPVVGCDLTDPEAVTKGVEEAVRLLAGGVDVLVNNAGQGGPAPAELRPSAEVHVQLDLNLLGAWDVTAAALPHLERARGRVVFIASRMAVLPLPPAAAYGVSKRTLAAYADMLRAGGRHARECDDRLPEQWCAARSTTARGKRASPWRGCRGRSLWRAWCRRWSPR
ncbi:SDR family NAD(P)-dependent oxidoreductase [Streptomyces griseoincarnatus]